MLVLVDIFLGPSLLPFTATSGGVSNFAAASTISEGRANVDFSAAPNNSTEVERAMDIIKQHEAGPPAVEVDSEDDDMASLSSDNQDPGWSDTFSLPKTAWDSSSMLDADALVEGCTHPATMTSVKAKNNKPSSGNVAALAIDGDGLTRWSVKGKNRWIEVKFDGGEGGDSLVDGVAIAFFRGDRRVAFFDVSRKGGRALRKDKWSF